LIVVNIFLPFVDIGAYMIVKYLETPFLAKN